MTTFVLVRHCALDALGHHLAGRAPGEHLNASGRAQVQELAREFAHVRLDAVYSSLLERARETAVAFAPCISDEVQFVDDLLELDFGEWTGKTFDELDADPRWAPFNAHRATTRIPGGELMLEVQARVVAFLQKLAVQWPDGRIAIVSHGDVLRAAIAYYLGISIDHLLRFEISPGGISLLNLGAGEPKLLCMNVVGRDAARLLG